MQLQCEQNGGDRSAVVDLTGSDEQVPLASEFTGDGNPSFVPLSTAGRGAPRGAVPPAPAAAPAPAPPAKATAEPKLDEVLTQLFRLLPGRAIVAGRDNGVINVSLQLDPGVLSTLEPVLRAGSDYQPFVPPSPETAAALNAHVLIVEDTVVARMLLRRMLEQLPGCRITEAVSGTEALALLNQGLLPDLCISDISMPDMDGLQLLKHIRSTPYLAHLDVMLCTSSSERETILKAAELNVCRYLLKPFNPATVKEQVREVLTHSAARQATALAKIQQRIGLSPAAVVEVLRGLGQQFAADVSAVRSQLAAGRRQGALMILQGLKGSCTTIKDQALVNRIDSVADHLNQGDLSATLEGLEGLQSEGKRISQLADRFALLLPGPANEAPHGAEPVSAPAIRLSAAA